MQAELDLAEHHKQKQVVKAMGKAAVSLAKPGQLQATGGGQGEVGWNLVKLRRIEQLVAQLRPQAVVSCSPMLPGRVPGAGEGSAPVGTDAKAGFSAVPSGPRLPDRKQQQPGMRGGKAGAGVESPAVQAALELQPLLVRDDAAAVYFRSCEGIAAVAEQVRGDIRKP